VGENLGAFVDLVFCCWTAAAHGGASELTAVV